MRETLRGVDAAGIERSCGPRPDSIRLGARVPGLERAEVHLTTCAFEPHRHDTYTIGVTTSGVQTFRYRGARRISLPGELVVLHPDETHDGAPGTADGFGYRALYVAPELVRTALDGSALPFVADPVHAPNPVTLLVASVVVDIDDPISDLSYVEIAATVADALRTLGRRQRAVGSRPRIDVRAAELARDYLAAHACEPTPASTLERITGVDRFTLTRHFRLAFGTSPDRYRAMRRVELARNAIESGQPLARVAATAGFSDQSHLTRQFKRAYGLTPGRWTALTGAARRTSGRERYSSIAPPIRRRCRRKEYDGSAARRAR